MRIFVRIGAICVLDIFIYLLIFMKKIRVASSKFWMPGREKYMKKLFNGNKSREHHISSWRPASERESGLVLQFIYVFFQSVKTHGKARMANQFSCELCPKTFASRRGLNYHKKTHSGAQRHLCPQRGISFSQSSALKTHSLIHTGEKPHKCNQCNYSTNRIGHLKRHIMKHT